MHPRYLIVFLAFIVMVFPAYAQEFPGEREVLRRLLEREVGRGAHGPPRVDERERDLRELLETVLMVRLSQALDLPVEQTLLLVRHLESFKDQLTEMKGMRLETRRALRRALEADATEQDIQARLDKLVGLDVSIANSTRAMIREASKDMSTAQTARLYLFVGDFDDEMRRLVRRARKLASGERGHGRPGHGGGADGPRDHRPPPREGGEPPRPSEEDHRPPPRF